MSPPENPSPAAPAEPSQPPPPAAAAKGKGKKKDEKKDDDLSEEDLALKEQLELYVVRAQDADPGVQKLALESMRQEIRSATSSMTSVPKPLKFLRPHFGTLKSYFETMPESELKKYMADILSVLALTMSIEGERESLKYRLLGSEGDIGSWGHEYVRNLAGEIAQEFQKRQDDDLPIDALMELVQQIVSFHMKHNAEPEAVDLLMEVEDLDLLVEHVDATNYKRACMYLTSSSHFLPAPDDSLALDIAYTIYMKFGDLASALRTSLKLEKSPQYVKQVYTATDDLLLKKQFSYLIARHGLVMEIDDEIAADDNDKEVLQEIVNNTKLSEGYLTLARDIEVMEPKSPEDIYKVHLIDGRGASSSLDSARQNLAATFVNAFVNAGFGQDKLMTAPSDSSSSGSSGNWLFKNKEHGKASAAASLGMILLWDTDSGLAQLDKYLHSNDTHVVAGALLGIGIVTCGVKSDCDPAFAILMEYIGKDDSNIRIGAILGLGIAYAGSQKEELKMHLSAVLGDSQSPLEVLVFSAIALGLVFVGSCNEEIAQSIIFALMERSEAELAEPIIRLLPVALGLLYLGKQVYMTDLTALYTWTCSRCNDLTRGFEMTCIIVDVQNCLQAFVGVDHNLNAIIVSIRGTQENSVQNWIKDIIWKQVNLNDPNMPNAKVHIGFYSSYNNTVLRSAITNAVRKARKLHGHSDIIVTGHSMGGAIASFCALDLAMSFGSNNVHLMTFGQPRVGNAAFASYFAKYVPKTIRMTHERDIVPHLPPYFFFLPKLTYKHFPREVWEHEVDGNTTYQVCDGSGEDPNCCRSVFALLWSASDHLTYMGVEIEADDWSTCRIVLGRSVEQLKGSLASDIVMSGLSVDVVIADDSVQVE